MTAIDTVLEGLRRFESRDVDRIVELFAEDGTFIDPHYPPPAGPALIGREAIRVAVGWSFSILKRPEFTVRHQFTAGEHVAGVEVDTRHLLVDGMMIEFPQVFIAEVGEDGLLRRLQAYLPYPPPVQG